MTNDLCKESAVTPRELHVAISDDAVLKGLQDSSQSTRNPTNASARSKHTPFRADRQLSRSLGTWPPVSGGHTQDLSRKFAQAVQLLGKGGFGQVSQGYDEIEGRHVAIKRVHFSCHLSPEDIRKHRALREVKVHCKVNDARVPGVIGYHSYGLFLNTDKLQADPHLCQKLLHNGSSSRPGAADMAHLHGLDPLAQSVATVPALRSSSPQGIPIYETTDTEEQTHRVADQLPPAAQLGPDQLKGGLAGCVDVTDCITSLQHLHLQGPVGVGECTDLELMFDEEFCTPADSNEKFIESGNLDEGERIKVEHPVSECDILESHSSAKSLFSPFSQSPLNQSFDVLRTNSFTSMNSIAAQMTPTRAGTDLECWSSDSLHMSTGEAAAASPSYGTPPSTTSLQRLPSSSDRARSCTTAHSFSDIHMPRSFPASPSPSPRTAEFLRSPSRQSAKSPSCSLPASHTTSTQLTDDARMFPNHHPTSYWPTTHPTANLAPDGKPRSNRSSMEDGGAGPVPPRRKSSDSRGGLPRSTNAPGGIAARLATDAGRGSVPGCAPGAAALTTPGITTSPMSQPATSSHPLSDVRPQDAGPSAAGQHSQPSGSIAQALLRASVRGAAPMISRPADPNTVLVREKRYTHSSGEFSGDETDSDDDNSSSRSDDANTFFDAEQDCSNKALGEAGRMSSLDHHNRPDRVDVPDAQAESNQRPRRVKWPLVLEIKMEFANAGNLEGWIAARNNRVLQQQQQQPPALSGTSSPLESIEKEIKLFTQIIKALRGIHELGCIHRDLKPANILLHCPACTSCRNCEHIKGDILSMTFQVKICDFGHAVYLSDCGPEVEVADSRKQQHEADTVAAAAAAAASASSRDNEIIEAADDPAVPDRKGQKQKHQNLTRGTGTGSYIAPEQARSTKYGCPADMFPAGLVLLELCHPIHTCHEKSALFKDARSGKLPACLLSSHPREASLIQRLLDHNPDNRPTAQQVIQALSLPPQPAPTPDPQATASAASLSAMSPFADTLQTSILSELGTACRDLCQPGVAFPDSDGRLEIGSSPDVPGSLDAWIAQDSSLEMTSPTHFLQHQKSECLNLASMGTLDVENALLKRTHSTGAIAHTSGATSIDEWEFISPIYDISMDLGKDKPAVLAEVRKRKAQLAFLEQFLSESMVKDAMSTEPATAQDVPATNVGGVDSSPQSPTAPGVSAEQTSAADASAQLAPGQGAAADPL